MVVRHCTSHISYVIPSIHAPSVIALLGRCLPRNLISTTMAPQTSIPPAANVLGTIGTICWCVQLVPQIYRNWRTKSTVGLPESMMLLWSISGVPFGVYAITQQFNIPLIVQPQCFCVLCGVSWAQCLVYSR